MAEIAPVQVTLDGAETMVPMSIGSGLGNISLGVALGDVTLWTRYGYKRVLEDLDNLQAGINNMRDLLEKKREQFVAEAIATNDEPADK